MTGSEKFRYQLPDDSPSRWEGLSSPAREALTETDASPEAADVLFAATESGPGVDVGQESGEWAIKGIQGALRKWRVYDSAMSKGARVPSSVRELSAGHGDFKGAISRLAVARTALRDSGEVNPKGKNLGDTMRVVLVPWQELLHGLDAFNTWMRNFYDVKKEATVHDANDMMGLISGAQVYRNPNGAHAPRLTPHEYLWNKTSSDGAWGIMLAQADGRPGASITAARSAAELTDSDARLSIAGQHVDDMGILEWISLTLQEGPRSLSNRVGSYLLANMDEETVPYGTWDIGSKRLRVSSQSIYSSAGNNNPRLAVL